MRTVLALLLCASAAAQTNPGRWPGMDKKNSAYDWLRPPTGVLRKIAAQKPGREVPDYRRTETIRFADGRSIILLSVSTPTQSMAAIAAVQWEQFAAPDESLFVSTVNQTRERFTVGLVSVAPGHNDVPKAAIEWTQGGEKWLLAGEGKVASSNATEECSGYRTVSLFTFEVGEDDRLASVGHIIIRWSGQERRIPLDFDYLW